MKQTYRSLLKHSGIYGVGQFLTSLTSILLLPVYTRFLTRADYGVLAILDLTISVLGILLASGIVRAVNRYHFEMETERERDRLWWTGLLLLGASLAAVVGPLFMLRSSLADLAFGPSVESGSYYLGLALTTLAFTAFGQVLHSHLRVYKMSALLVGISLAQVLLAVALNLTFLIRFELGLAGVLWGNLLSGAAGVAAHLVVFLRFRKGFAIDWGIARPLASYGAPLIVASLLALGMHQADRYLLRVFLDLERVGLYSVAYKVGQGINTLILVPFSQIWYVAIYEMAGDSSRRRIFSQTFRFFFDALLIIMLGVSLFAEPLLKVLVAPDFYPAAQLVPIICLGYFLFSLHTHFNVPALIAKRTTSIAYAHALGFAVNVVANLLLIPRLGIFGAAWATVVTFAAFSLSGLLLYRRIDAYDYPFARCGLVLAGAIASFAAWQGLTSFGRDPLRSSLAAAVVWLLWSFFLLGLPLLRLWFARSRPHAHAQPRTG